MYYLHKSLRKMTNKQISMGKILYRISTSPVDFFSPHRMLKYGNPISLVWFSKYAIRGLKPVKDMVADLCHFSWSAPLLTLDIGLMFLP